MTFSLLWDKIRWQGDQMSCEKIAQNMAQPIFCRNLFKSFKVGKAAHKKFNPGAQNLHFKKKEEVLISGLLVRGLSKGLTIP
jgi:hypothetical protein